MRKPKKDWSQLFFKFYKETHFYPEHAPKNAFPNKIIFFLVDVIFL